MGRGMTRGTGLLVPVLVVLLASGCGSGSAPAASPGGVGSLTPATAAATAAASPIPVATEAALPGPPAAYLQGPGLDDPGAGGAEGSFTWDGSGSDAPWVVRPSPDARGAGPWTVAFDPPGPVVSWTARWAPVEDGVAGDPAAATSGAGAPIQVRAPSVAATWSLQLDVSFGAGRRAAWYWTVDVVP